MTSILITLPGHFARCQSLLVDRADNQHVLSTPACGTVLVLCIKMSYIRSNNLPHCKVLAEINVRPEIDKIHYRYDILSHFI